MKNIFLLLILFTTQLFSLTIVLNSAKESGTPYAILHIQDNELIDCQEIPQSLDKVIYLCKFDKIVKTPIEPKKMSLVEIDFLEKDKEFYIRIKPKIKSKLVPVKSTLYENDEVSKKEIQEKYNHWTILLYEKSPFVGNIGKDAINFPIMYPKAQKPFVGALDLNGAPISYVQSKDIKLYLDLKYTYEREKYLDVIEDSLDAVKKYPYTIFKSEFLLYRLRALDKGMEEIDSKISEDYDSNDIVSEGKRWMKLFPSDNNIAEVVMLIAKAYLDMGFKADANYFIDILISEHENSPFTRKGILVFADSLYNTNQQDKAIKLYKDVLYSAQDLDIAAEAAIRLTEKEINRGQTDEAKEYLLKVLDANKEYLLKDRESSYALAKKLARNKLYDVAAKVADVLLIGMRKTEENRESILKDSGIWHTKANDIEDAYKNLQLYLSDYRDGEYEQEVQSNLDELFFELNETNETKLAKYYDELIDKYKNKIGDKALEEKAKLLLSQKRYKDVLLMEDALKYTSDNNSSEIPPTVDSAASSLVNLSLKDDQCTQAVFYIERYNLDVVSFDTKKVFECLIRTSRYDKAKELSEGYIAQGELKLRFEWLERYLLSIYNLKQYQSTIDVGEDIIAMSKTLKLKPKYETLSMIFFAQMRLDKIDEAIKISKNLEKDYPDDLKNAEVYMEIVKKATDDRNDLLLSQYAQKTIALQNKYKQYIYTPQVELNLIGALQRLEKPKEAFDIAKGLVDKKMSLNSKSRVLYNAGELSMKLNNSDDAKKYFQQCVDLKSKSSWEDICIQNLKLL